MEGPTRTPHTSISDPNNTPTPNERNLQLKCDRLQDERDRFKHGLWKLRNEHIVLQGRFEEIEICKGEMEEMVRRLELSCKETEEKIRRVEAEKHEMEETIRRLSEKTPEPSMEEMERFIHTVAPALTLPGWYEPQLATPPNDEHPIEEVDEEMDVDRVTLPPFQYPFDDHDSTSTSEDSDSEEESSPSPPPSKLRKTHPSISPSLTSSTLLEPPSPIILDSIRVKPRPRPPPPPPPKIKRQFTLTKGGVIRGRGGAPLILSSPPKKQTTTRPRKKRVSSSSTRASARIARLSQPPLTVSIVPAKPGSRTPTQWDVDAGRRVSVPPSVKFMLRIPPRPQALATKN